MPYAGSMTTWKGRYWSVSFHATAKSVDVPLLVPADNDEFVDVELNVRVRTTVVGWEVAPGDVGDTKEVMTLLSEEDEFVLADEECCAALEIDAVLDWANESSRMTEAITTNESRILCPVGW